MSRCLYVLVGPPGARDCSLAVKRGDILAGLTSYEGKNYPHITEPVFYAQPTKNAFPPVPPPGSKLNIVAEPQAHQSNSDCILIWHLGSTEVSSPVFPYLRLGIDVCLVL